MMKATLFIICGLPASGKTTLALALVQKHNAILLSEDEWMKGICKSYYNEDYKERIVEFQKQIAERLLTIGTNVVMDGGYWGKEERDGLRECAKKANANLELHYMKVPLEELKRRAAERNKSLAEEFQTKMEDLEIAFYKQFQEPNNTENFILHI